MNKNRSVVLMTGAEVCLGTLMNVMPRVATLGRAYTGTLKRLHEAALAWPKAGSFTSSDELIFRNLGVHFFAGTFGCLTEEIAEILKAMVVGFMPLAGDRYFARLRFPVKPDSWGHDDARAVYECHVGRAAA